MKRVLALLLTCFVLILMLAGCQGAKETSGDTQKAAVTEKTQGQKDEAKPKEGGIDIGIVLPTKQESRWLGDEAKFRKAIEEKKLNAEILFSQNSSAIEKTNVESLISMGAKVIVLCPYDATAAAA